MKRHNFSIIYVSSYPSKHKYPIFMLKNPINVAQKVINFIKSFKYFPFLSFWSFTANIEEISLKRKFRNNL